MAANSLNNPFNGKPYTTGVPGASDTLGKTESVKLPKSSQALGRLAHAISKLPYPVSSRGNAKDLFL